MPVKYGRRRHSGTETLHPLYKMGLPLVLTASALPQVALNTIDVIHVEIGGFRTDKGQVLCTLFSSATDFPKHGEKALAHAHPGIAQREAVCEFSGIAPGRYAVSVFHDENSNGKMDTNFIGMPKEGVGASNDAKGRFGPPGFDAAAFQYTGGKLELKIKLAYL